MKRITDIDVLKVLKAHKLSIDAKGIAELLGQGVTSRAVATASRQLVADGQVSLRYFKAKGEQRRGFYRYVRWAPRPGASL